MNKNTNQSADNNKKKQPQNKKPQQKNNKGKGDNNGLSKASRGAAIRAARRNHDDAQRILSQYATAQESTYDQKNEKGNKDAKSQRANKIDDSPRLKVIGLGGMDGGGSKNMILVEYENDAVVMDCGNDLGVDLPGINYGIADVAYLEKIKHKLRAYVITHGHLDHIGGLPHIVPRLPAPIYGSKFTIARVEEVFSNFGPPLPDNFSLDTVAMNEDTHERLKIGQFFVELVRVTHSIPGSTMIVLDTPVGRLINSGDFRFDPKPLDHERTDTDRLKQLGEEGVLALLSESTTTERPGRTPSESTIEQSFIDIIDNSPGRIFVGVFSTNMNRIQMIVNAAVHHGRKVVMDGRSMVSTLEMSVRHGFMKIPKGTFVPMASASSVNDDELIVICTGSQGEPSSALQRMGSGDHRHIKLKEQDTVILSSTPIPESGNDARIGIMVDDLLRKGVHVFRHETHEIDSCGPLHVSGHASIEEYRDLIQMTKPKFFIPIYGAYRSKQRHMDIAIEEGIPRKNMVNAENGEIITLTKDKLEIAGKVPAGTVLVDQTGAIVNSVVIKDRLLLSEEGLVAVILTVDKKTGSLLTSPDIISRGFIYMRDNEELMNNLRAELKRAVNQRFKRVELDRFKQELKDHISHFVYEHTKGSPIVIPVVNVVAPGRPSGNNNGGNNKDKKSSGAKTPPKTADEIAAEQQKRFEEMRAKLLGQDARTD